MGELTDGDLEGLQTRHILEVARALRDRSPERLPAALFERLNSMEAQLLSSVAAGPLAPVAKDAPEGRPNQHPDTGRVITIPEVGGLHHRCERRAA